MFKITLLSLALFAGSLSAVQAGVIVNHSNKASPASVVAKNFEKAVGEGRIEFFQAGNCEEAEKKFNGNQSAVMIYNADVGIAAKSKNLACPLTAKPAQTVFIGKSYLRVCTKAGSSTPIQKARTMGAASVILSPGLIRDYNSNGMNLRGVPYGGSKDVLAALISGDVDFGFVASAIADPAVAAGQISCPFTTDPREANYVGNTFKLQIPSLPIAKVFYTNSQDAKFVESLRQAAKSTDFQAYLKKAGYSDIKIDGITAADIQQVQRHIDDSVKFYWK
jgi:hypothetical protein